MTSSDRLMKAFQLTEWASPGELRTVRVPEPGPGQVLIRVTASGACHSDLHLMDWPEGQLPWRLPFTLGHETAGVVHQLGDGVTELAPGDPVLVYGPWGCGQCRQCRLGRENTCERAASIPAAGGGLGRDGGMAEFMLVPSSRLLVPLGDLDPVQAAPLADAALTPYHAVTSSLDRLHPGSTAVVIGVGGLGHMAIQLLKAVSAAQVIAVDIDDGRLEASRRFGADAVVRSDDRALDAIRALGGGGVDLVLDMVGSDATLALGARALRAEGRLVIVGLAMGSLPLSFFALPYGAEVATSYWGTVPELMEVLSLARAGRIRVEVESFPLDRTAYAYAALRRGAVHGRAVVVPAGR
jgi:propanol-preferring alcohol dehydrogenase